MLAYTVSIAKREDARAELGDELSQPREAMAKYRRLSVLLFGAVIRRRICTLAAGAEATSVLDSRARFVRPVSSHAGLRMRPVLLVEAASRSLANQRTGQKGHEKGQENMPFWVLVRLSKNRNNCFVSGLRLDSRVVTGCNLFGVRRGRREGKRLRRVYLLGGQKQVKQQVLWRRR
jgi:hypothetical protein